MKNKIVVLMALVAILALPFTALAADEAAPAAAAPEAAPEQPAGPFVVGQVIKGVMVTTLDGKSFDLASVEKKSLLVFMNTACSACQQEMKAVQNFYLRNKSKVDYIAIAVDLNGEATLPGFIERSRSKATFYLDSSFEAAEKFGFSYTPATVLLDKGGKVLYKSGGWMKSQAKKKLAAISELL